MAAHAVILVDSDILIAHLRGLPAARDWFIEARGDGPLAISVVSVAALAGGMRTGERREVWRLLASLCDISRCSRTCGHRSKFD